MKIKNLAIITLMITFLIILGTKAYATTGKINEETVKLRKAPDSKTVLDLLDEGDEVEILEQEDGWYKVKATTGLGKVTGYVSEEFIDVKKDASSDVVEESVKEQVEEPIEESIQENVEEPIEVPETNETVSTDITSENIKENNKYTLEQEISIKALPLMNSIEKSKITGNITIIEIINDWARIESDTHSGWIRVNILKQSIQQVENPLQEQPVEPVIEETIITDLEPPVITEPEKTEKIEETGEIETTINKNGYVSAEGLRVRKEPTTDSEELDSLSKNDKVKIIGQTGNWYKIDLNGEIGYVSAKYISDAKLPETTSRSGSSLKTEQNDSTDSEETPKEETSVPETSNSGTTGAAVVEYAKQYLGYKYVSGGASPSAGFDCSGFTSYIYKHFGISLNRSSKDQIKNGNAVAKSDLQLGDIVIFNNDANTAIGHVGIYVGDGNFIHASNPSDGVKITTLLTGYYQKRYVGARRVI